MKIKVPKEFEVFLENAEEVINEYQDEQGRPDLFRVTNDLAKFQYYLRGRLHEIEATSDRALTVADTNVGMNLMEDCKAKTESILHLIDNCQLLLSAIHDAVITRDI